MGLSNYLYSAHPLRAGGPLYNVGTVLCHLRLGSSSHENTGRKVVRESGLGTCDLGWGHAMSEVDNIKVLENGSVVHGRVVGKRSILNWNHRTLRFIQNKENSQRSKDYRSEFSRYTNMTSFSNTDLCGFSYFPFSNKTTIFAALKEEHGKQMSRMCVSLRNSQGDSERSCSWSGALLVLHMDPRLPGWQILSSPASPSGWNPEPSGQPSSPPDPHWKRLPPLPVNHPGHQGPELSLQNWLSHWLREILPQWGSQFLFLHRIFKRFHSLTF